MLQSGQLAPDHQAIGLNGTKIDLGQLYQQRHVIVYFYPKDFTPGCTQEALDFKQYYDEITNYNGVIVGVSKDTDASHAQFASSHQLPFQLIADESTELCQKFGVWQEKQMFKRVYMGIVRSTFLIQKGGLVHKTWNKLRVKNHVKDVVQELSNLK